MATKTVGDPAHVALWDAINKYAYACGGHPDKYVYGNTTRQKAVSEVERAVERMIAGPADPPQAAPGERVSEADIREVLRLSGEVAPGPWEVDITDAKRSWRRIRAGRSWPVCDDSFTRHAHGESEEHSGVRMSEQTAAFIVAVRDIAPRLAREVLALRAENTRLQAVERSMAGGTELEQVAAWKAEAHEQEDRAELAETERDEASAEVERLRETIDLAQRSLPEDARGYASLHLGIAALAGERDGATASEKIQRAEVERLRSRPFSELESAEVQRLGAAARRAQTERDAWRALARANAAHFASDGVIQARIAAKDRLRALGIDPEAP